MGGNEDKITRAIEACDSGAFGSLRAAAIAYGASQSTVWRRVNNQAQTRSDANQYRQRLSKEQEKLLTDWILDQSAGGFSPSASRVRAMAEQMLRHQGDDQPLGKTGSKASSTGTRV